MKLAVVIGGSSGIGLSVMNKLSEHYHTVNMSRTAVDGHENITTDVTDRESVRKAFCQLSEKYGIPQIMIYCAGFVEPQSIFETTEEIWNKTLQVNLTGAFYCTQEFVKLSRQTKGKIIYIASTAGTRAQPGWSAYSAAKAGLINFSLTMSEELKEYDMRVYCISPGRCATPLRKILAPNEDQSTIMQPDEVAEFVYYLINYDKVLDNQVIIVKKNSS